MMKAFSLVSWLLLVVNANAQTDGHRHLVSSNTHFETCVQQDSCTIITTEKITPQIACASGECEYEICMELDYTKEGCTKMGPVEHTCEPLSPGCDDTGGWNLVSVQGNAQNPLLNPGPTSKQCQTVSAGGTATFVFFDGRKCDKGDVRTIDRGCTRCFPAPSAECIANGKRKKECVWEIDAPATCDDEIDIQCGGTPPPPTPDIKIDKTVILGSEGSSPTSCSPGLELVSGKHGQPVTFCFEITNTGNTYLKNLHLTDDCLPVDLVYSGITNGILGPGGQIRIPHFTTITHTQPELLCDGNIKGTPIEPDGTELGLPDVTDADPAGVTLGPKTTDCVTNYNQEMDGDNMRITITEGCDHCACPEDYVGPA